MRFLTAVAANMLGTFIALGGVFIFGLIMMAVLIGSASRSAGPIRSDSVLLLDLSGTVPEVVSGDPFAQSFGGESAYGLYDLTESLKRAGSDDRIKALWLRTGNVSSSWASLQTIRRALTEFKESGKPIIASGKSFTLPEKALYLASVADSIFADPHTMVEMNGFAMTVEFYKNLLDRLHIKVEVVRAGTYKSAVEPFFRTNLSDNNRDQLQAILDDITDTFVWDVAESRGLEPEYIRRQMDNNGTITAKDALESGLLDGLRYDDEVRRSLALSAGLDPDDKLRTVSFNSYARDSRKSMKRGPDEVAVVYAVGSIMPGKSSDVPNPFLGGKTVGSETFMDAIRRARRSKRTKAIVIRINSPGGVAPAADAMLREIREAAQELPVVISMGDVAASGGYWMAMGSQTVVAEPLTLTGSIGVFSLMFNASGFMDETLGINYDGVKSGPYADMYSGLRSFSTEERAMLQRSTDQIYRAFLGLVADARDLEVDDVDRLAQGRVWTGMAAKERGLIDELGGLDRAIELAVEAAGIDADQLGIRVYSTPRGFLERFSQPLVRALVRVVFSVSGSDAANHLMKTSNHLSDLIGANGKVLARMPYLIETR